MENIRNFVIIAHIDHGKSTLADRLLEVTKTVEKRRMRAQYLDQMDLERERGITIKMAPVRMIYHAQIPNSKLQITNKSQIQNGLGFGASDLGFANSKQEFVLNLIDTPGHSDFSYEVSRGLAAAEGAILLVDGTQGLQAQTLSNFHSARAAGLKIIGAVNKIDMKPPQLETIIKNLALLLEVQPHEIFRVSAKTGDGVERLLNAVIEQVPAPLSEPMETFRGLVFDSLYNEHKGIMAFVRSFSGKISAGKNIYLLATGAKAQVKEVGYFAPELKKFDAIDEGNIGYIATGIKNPDALKIGDTISDNQNANPLPGYKEPKPVIFVSFYPENNDDYEDLKQSLRRLKLNDPSLTFDPDSNELLGRGFKCGFLGQLHFEITAERLEKEFKLKTVSSFPSVTYEVKIDGRWETITSPKDFPLHPEQVKEPIVNAEILTPTEYLGQILGLKERFRFENMDTSPLGSLMLIKVSMPLSDLMLDFDDTLKALTEGYASFSYEMKTMALADVSKLEVHVAGQLVPGLSRILPKKDLIRESRSMAKKLKEVLPAQQIPQPIQVIADGKVLAREDIPALRKDVTGYLYGGDRTRKMKLWQKQKKGKKKMIAMTKINIPAKAYIDLLKKK